MKCRNCKNNTLLDDGEQFNWCEIRHDNLDIDEERYCEAFSQATNGDKFRAMTDEELAILFAKLKAKPNVLDRMVQSYSGRDVNEWLDWLKQEATE